MSRSFLKFMLSVFVVAALATASFAQDEANMARPNTKAGSAAWIFSFGGLSTLGLNTLNIGNNNGVVPAAGWKYYLSDDLAIRALLGFSTLSSGADTVAPNFHNSSTAIGIAVGVEMHTHPVYSTSPYFGAQISYGSGSADQTINKSVNNTFTEVKSSSSAFGIAVLAGFDWYFTKGLAVGGEYVLGFTTGSSSSTKTLTSTGASTTVDNPSTTSIGIGSASNANVHLVVHF